MKKSLRKIVGTSKKITPEIHHKVKATERRKEVIRLKNDMENEQIMPKDFRGTHPLSIGKSEFAKNRAKIRKARRVVLYILVSIPVLYILIINIFNI
jgi:hypothetical protein